MDGRRWLAALLAAMLMLLAAVPASAELVRTGILDAAYGCVEEGNIFLERYKQITGSDTQARLTDGVPFFYGGQDLKAPFNNEPGYASRKAWMSSKYFVKDSFYYAGFDCVGFVKYAYATGGRRIRNKLS